MHILPLYSLLSSEKQMKVFQPEEDKLDQEKCKNLRSSIEHTTLRNITDAVEIYYDPDVQSTVIEADRDMVESYFIIPEEADNVDRQGKWLARLVLGRRKLLDKGLLVSDVAAKIKAEYHDQLAIIFSDNNADEQVIRIRRNDQDKDRDLLGDDC